MMTAGSGAHRGVMVKFTVVPSTPITRTSTGVVASPSVAPRDSGHRRASDRCRAPPARVTLGTMSDTGVVLVRRAHVVVRDDAPPAAQA